MTYRCYTLGTILQLDSAPFSRKPDSELRLIPPSSRQALPYPGSRLHQTRERHLSTSSVMLAMPSNIIRHRFRVCRKQDHRQEQHHERSSVLLSLRHFSAGPMEFRTFHVQLLKLCFRPQESNQFRRKGVNLNGLLRRRRQGALGAFTLCPETRCARGGPHQLR